MISQNDSDRPTDASLLYDALRFARNEFRDENDLPWSNDENDRLQQWIDKLETVVDRELPGGGLAVLAAGEQPSDRQINKALEMAIAKALDEAGQVDISDEYRRIIRLEGFVDDVEEEDDDEGSVHALAAQS
jgi:hypothetical protein